MAQTKIPVGAGAGKVYPPRKAPPKPNRAQQLLKKQAALRAQQLAAQQRAKKAGGGKKAPVPATATQPSTTNPSQDPGQQDITSVHSYNDLQKEAQSQIDTETAGAIAPLQSGVNQLGTREDQARKEIEGLYSELQPYAVESARRIRDANDNLASTEKNIMAQTEMRMNSLRQSAAQDAQGLAQRMGGPVAMDAFTGGVDPAIQEQTGLGAGLRLYSSEVGAGQAGAAEHFAGSVLPAVEHQDFVNSEANFESQKKTIMDQILALQSAKSGKTNDRLNQLITQERQYQLQKADEHLKQVQANRDAKVRQQALHNDSVRLKLAQQQFSTDVGFKKISATQAQQRIQISQQRLTTQQRQNAKRLGLDEAKFKELLRHNMATEGIARQREKLAQQKNSIALAKSLANPAGDKPVSVESRIVLDPKSPEAQNVAGLVGLKGSKYHMDRHGNIYYWQRQTMPMSKWAARNGVSGGAADPKTFYKSLTRRGVTPKMARELTKQYFPKWGG